MTRHTTCLTIILILVLAACGSSSNSESAPTGIPFPTVTSGYTLYGVLSTPRSLSQSALANPATAAALANQPTATPRIGSCPRLLSDVDLRSLPSSGDAVASEILRYLSAGGGAVALETALRDDWEVLGDTGFVRSDVDLTGEGVSETIVSYTVPSEGGNLLIAGCETGRYVARYQSTFDAEAPPQLIYLGDTNYDGLNEIVFVTQHCEEEDDCPYQTHILSWQPGEWRFVSLLGATIESFGLPEMMDMDDDEVYEIVVRMDYYGSLATGPLRTGVLIYDWNGSVFVLSIPQINPPRYRIQYVQAADRLFAAGNMPQAINLYQTVLTDEDLGTWLFDEKPILDSYILYRMLLARAVSDDIEAQSVYQYILETYLDAAQDPVYIAMSRAFWDTFQVVSNLGTACDAVQVVVAERPEAVDLLNRYGSRNPTYTAQDLCPY